MRHQRQYDHRLVELVRDTGAVGIPLVLGIPRSTAAGQQRRGSAPVVCTELRSVNAAKVVGQRKVCETMKDYADLNDADIVPAVGEAQKTEAVERRAVRPSERTANG